MSRLSDITCLIHFAVLPSTSSAGKLNLVLKKKSKSVFSGALRQTALRLEVKVI